MTPETISTLLGWGLFLLVALVIGGVLVFLLDQRQCPGCGSDDTLRYPDSRICRSCGRVWR